MKSEQKNTQHTKKQQLNKTTYFKKSRLCLDENGKISVSKMTIWKFYLIFFSLCTSITSFYCIIANYQAVFNI